MTEPAPIDPHGQSKYQVRFDWGSQGGRAIAAGASVIVVIDAISFTTTVEIAASHGLEVVPFDGIGDPVQFAESLGAVIAGPRGGAGVTLSPSSIDADSVLGIAPHTRVLMQSLNGSRVSASLAPLGIPIIAASLRNRTAVADWILRQREEVGDRTIIAVVAAGETRADGGIRFAVEDLLVAGAVIDALAGVGIDGSSPEAAAAGAAFAGSTEATAQLLIASASGQELGLAGQIRDVELAGELDVSTVVPVLRECGYRA